MNQKSSTSSITSTARSGREAKQGCSSARGGTIRGVITFAAELKPYIDRLEAANGLIECPQAKKLSIEMKQENKDAAKLYESEAYRLKALDKAYSIAFPESTPINVNKKKEIALQC